MGKRLSSLLIFAVFTAIIVGNAAGFEGFQYTDYYGEEATEAFILSLPSGYLTDIELSGNGTTITRFIWSDAYMRDFRVTLIEKSDAGTLAELISANEERLNAENRLDPGEIVLPEAVLNLIGADEGYRGEYLVEESAREYYHRKILYLEKNDTKFLLDVAVHTGKLEGGLDIVQKILGSFRING